MRKKMDIYIQKDHSQRRTFVVTKWRRFFTQNGEAYFILGGFLNKQNCFTRGEKNPWTLTLQKCTGWCWFWYGENWSTLQTKDLHFFAVSTWRNRHKLLLFSHRIDLYMTNIALSVFIISFYIIRWLIYLFYRADTTFWSK